MAKVETSLAPRLVTAVDIALSRLGPRPHGGVREGIAHYMRYETERQKAADELERGEWVMPDVDSQIVASASHTLAGTALTDAPSGVLMSGGAEPAGAAKHPETHADS